MKSINRNQLFVASCLALLVTSLSFGIRAGILNRLGVQFNLTARELGIIAGTAFWGFIVSLRIITYLKLKAQNLKFNERKR